MSDTDLKPNILLLLSDRDVCAQVTAMLGEYFSVRVCSRPSEVLSTLSEHKCRFVVICQSFCNPGKIDWSTIIKSTRRIDVMGVFVSVGWLNNKLLVEDARDRWGQYMNIDYQNPSLIAELIETATSALNVRGEWA